MANRPVLFGPSRSLDQSRKPLLIAKESVRHARESVEVEVETETEHGPVRGVV